MKQCSQCGAALPEQASFCPYCTATQITRREVIAPQERKRGRGILLLAVVLITAAACFLLPRLGADPLREEEAVLAPIPFEQTLTTEGAAYPYCFSYTAENGTHYRLFTSFTPELSGKQRPRGSDVRYMAEDNSGDSPITLFVENASRELCAEEFTALIGSYSVEITPQDASCEMTVSDPGDGEAKALFAGSGALLYKRVHMRNAYGLRLIRWTLRMKNGDELFLEQAFDVKLRKTVRYNWQETPMNTAEELQKLLDSLPQLGTSEQCRVTIELPAVTYDQPLHCTRQVDLYGQSGTVFTGQLTLSGDEHCYVSLQNIAFAGDGGVGLETETSVYVRECRFTGWTTAVAAEDGGWIRTWKCRFEDNGTALLYHSGRCSEFGPQMENNVFRHNGVAVDLEDILPMAWLEPTNCAFEQNGEDIRNPYGYPVITVSCTYS